MLNLATTLQPFMTYCSTWNAPQQNKLCGPTFQAFLGATQTPLLYILTSQNGIFPHLPPTGPCVKPQPWELPWWLWIWF